MSSPTILDFQFDAENEDELAGHGLAPRQVLQVLDGKVDISANKKSGRATHRVIGRDHGGQAITIFVEPTSDPIVWRPITGWRSEPHEEDRL